jgi:VanZ family protein
MNLRVPLLPRPVRWSLVLALGGFIFYASIITAPPETVIDRSRPDLLPLDKWRHLLAYAALGGSLGYALLDSEAPVRRVAAVTVLASATYGVGIELWQALVPARYFSLGDAYANAFGAALSATWYLARPLMVPTPVGQLLHAPTQESDRGDG